MGQARQRQRLLRSLEMVLSVQRQRITHRQTKAGGPVQIAMLDAFSSRITKMISRARGKPTQVGAKERGGTSLAGASDQLCRSAGFVAMRSSAAMRSSS